MTMKGEDGIGMDVVGRNGCGSGRDGSPSRPNDLKRPQSKGRDRSPNGPQLINNGGFGETALPRRKILRHDVPSWIPEGATFFITINSLPRGQNQLATPAVATALMESIATRVERGHWWPRLVLFMPDHLHALMVFPTDQDLPKIVRDWKRYTARKIGIRWQRDFFDHRIRNERSLEEKWNYVAQNPIRAGLVTSPDDWPYVWFGRDASPKRPVIGRDGIGRDGSPSRPKIFK
jgi:putative transposase